MFLVITSYSIHYTKLYEDQVVCRILAETGIDPGLLELELTESMIMRDPQVAAATMHQLKNLGVSLALDDFGTGYSSLNYLRRFPVDSLKIDRSFISDVAVDPKMLHDDHPLANLAGVGVAYKLAEALSIKNRKSETANLLDLVALGLIADVALLKGDTRALAQIGLEALRNS